MKTITITINHKTGDAAIDLDGYHGQGCAEVMAGLTAGQDITHSPKPEMYESETELSQYDVQGY